MPYRIDLFAIFIFIGVVQAIFLSFFFFSKESRQKPFNLFYGLLLISIAACLLEILLMYSGYIVHVLHLVDFSEPFALLIGPFFYLFVLSLIKGKVAKKAIWSHVAFPILYTLAMLPFLLSPTSVKYNAWAVAYHPEWVLRHWRMEYDPWMFLLTEWHTELVIFSLGLYVTLSTMVIAKTFRERKESFWKPATQVLNTMRHGALQLTVFIIMIVAVKIFNKNDTGDHLFAAFGAVLVYATSFSVIRNSDFFRQVSIADDKKYKASLLEVSEVERISLLLLNIMKEQKPYLKSNFSLPKLAQLSHASVHVVSQVVNEAFKKNFFEWLAEYRVGEAEKILKESAHLKIEEVAEQVGYNSKSSFNTAFKKITGKTPSEYRRS